MMRKPELFLYRLIVWLHPAAFREEFGREMLLDFEESLTHEGAARIFFDALLSVARQWARCAVSGSADRVCEAQPSLLAGEYAPLRDQPLNVLELGRGLFASLVLLGLCGYSLGHARRIRSFDIVYAASQGARMAEGGAAGQTSGSSSASGAVGRQFTQFDVISIRENKSPGPPHISFPMTNDDSYVPTHGYMQVSGLPLFVYIQFAYRTNMFQATTLLKQLPDWATSARYDIEARVEGDPDKDDMRRMVRALLASRFGLQLHTETKIGNVYDLTLAHAGRTGPSLQRHPADDVDCKDNPPAGYWSPCGAIRLTSGNPNNGTLRIAGRKITLDLFALYMSTEAGRPMLNKTGLTGDYDFTLEFVPPKIGGAPDPNASEPAAGAIFPDAVQEQMGLKLEPDKGPVTTYVLDHVEKPSEN